MEEKKVYLVYGVEYTAKGVPVKEVLGVTSTESGARRKMNQLELLYKGLYDEFMFEPWVVEEE